MTYLFLSIALTSYLILCFRFFERWHISNLQAIVVNYVVCVLTGWMVTGEMPFDRSLWQRSWWPIAVILGFNFFFIFNMMGHVARRYSVALTSIASKLSLVIPVAAAIVLFDEPFHIAKIVSLVLALAAVIITSVQPGQQAVRWLPFLSLALLIFLGSGLNDTLVNVAVQRQVHDHEHHAFNGSVFFFAAVSGLLLLVARLLFLRQWPDHRAVLAGVALGIPNYFSLFFLIKALDWPVLHSSSVLILNNVGIVLLTTACGLWLFHEKLTMRVGLGLALGLAAMFLLLGYEWNYTAN